MPWPEIVASETVQKLLATQKQYLKHSGAIALVDSNGFLVASSASPSVKSFSVTDRDYFLFHRDNPSEDTFIGEPVIGKLLDKPSLTMSKALRRQDGKFDGLILITMPIEYFAALFDGAASPTDAAEFLRGNGEVVVSVPFRKIETPVPAWFAQAVAKDPNAGVIDHVGSAEGISRMVAYRKVAEFPFYVTYGIDENALLDGWRQSILIYGAVLATALAAFLATAWLARRRSIALLYSNESLREVSEKLLVSQDEERRSIARDLHDSTGQHLIAAGMELENARSSIGEPNEKTSSALTRTSQLIAQSNQELRTLSYLLHPPMLDESGLPNALELLVSGFEERSGIDIELRIEPALETKRPPAGVELAIFRVVQEGLTNIYRHSHAKKATIRLVRHGEGAGSVLLLTVKDDGVGIQRRDRHNIGVGLSGMEARIRPLGGTFDVSTGKTGTVISVKVQG
jgi:signal transduction histidine kinase